MKPKNMTRPFRLLTQPLWLALLMLAVFSESVAQADSGNSSTDEVFGGQILSLTEEKPPLKPSNDPRFQDNKDGTITDLEKKLIWKKIDLYQEKKIWSSWEDSQKLIESFNKEAYAKYSDWRLPTRNELKSLYEEDKKVPWKYYWTENVVHIDPIFGYSHCCFWSSELYKDKYAWGFNYISGRDYPSMKGGGQYHLSLSTIRPVRSIVDKESLNVTQE
jgi:hypothetical protein